MTTFSRCDRCGREELAVGAAVPQSWYHLFRTWEDEGRDICDVCVREFLKPGLLAVKPEGSFIYQGSSGAFSLSHD